MTPRIKICCISSIEEAKLALRYGASSIGLVSDMPSGPGVISEELIEEIALEVPPLLSTFLLTSKQDAASIMKQQKRCKVNILQLCDGLTKGTYMDLRKELPGIKIVQVIHVTGEESVEEAKAIAPEVDALLLDSGNTSSPVKELGGTGRTHDWSLSRKIVDSVDIPVWLAGGLNPDNIADAINSVKPYGVDVCSGVRTDSKLDEEKLYRFTDQVKMRSS